MLAWVSRSCSARLALMVSPNSRPMPHRLPEDEGKPGSLCMLGHLRPMVYGDIDQRFAAIGIVKIAIGEDGKLGPDRTAAQIADNVGKGLEPVQHSSGEPPGSG